MDRVDACLLGGRMYPGYEQYWTAIRQAPDQPLPMTGKLPHPDELRWSEFVQHTPHYVLSTTLNAVNWPQTHLLRHADAVRDLKAQAGKDIYLMGGASLVGSMLDAGLVDEMHCIVYPLLVGHAKGPLDRLTHRRELKLLGQRQVGEGLIHLAYQIR
jgi:dihydrofolate reductase